jgi:hypothetical protein
MTRAGQRADRAIYLIDQLLSGRTLQRSTRKKLVKLRRELAALRNKRDVDKVDVVTSAMRWAVAVARLTELLSQIFD